MVKFSKFVGYPTCLSDVRGFSKEHIKRCLIAAKDPQLEMKLKNMPVPLNAGLVDEYGADPGRCLGRRVRKNKKYVSTGGRYGR